MLSKTMDSMAQAAIMRRAIVGLITAFPFAFFFRLSLLSALDVARRVRPISLFLGLVTSELQPPEYRLGRRNPWSALRHLDWCSRQLTCRWCHIRKSCYRQC